MVDLRGDSSPASSPLNGEIPRIVLTGFMGAGESAVGRLLADRTERELLDLDTHVETDHRQERARTLRRPRRAWIPPAGVGSRGSVLQLSQAIIAPGGAVIDMPANQSILLATECSQLRYLSRRAVSDADRPLLATG